MAKKKKSNRRDYDYFNAYGFPPPWAGGPDGFGPGGCPPGAFGPGPGFNPGRMKGVHPYWAWMSAQKGSWDTQEWTRGWLDFQNPAYVKGLVMGALAAGVASNPAAQKKTMQTLASLWGMMQGGVEELKERFRDMEAEMQATARNASAREDDDFPATS